MSQELLDQLRGRLRTTMYILAVGAAVFLAAPFVLTSLERDLSTEVLGLLFLAVALCAAGVVRLAKVTQQLSGT